HVPPIGATASNKFIAALPLGTEIGGLSSLSYDFMIDPAGVVGPTTYKQFYLNVYTNLPDSSTFYDCRFDYVPTSGSSSAFTRSEEHTSELQSRLVISYAVFCLKK